MKFLGEETVNAALEERPNSMLSPQETAILGYVRKMTLAPQALNKSDAHSVLEAGVSDEALWHAVTVSSLFHFYNAWVDGGGTQPPTAAQTKFYARELKEEGYLVDRS